VCGPPLPSSNTTGGGGGAFCFEPFRCGVDRGPGFFIAQHLPALHFFFSVQPATANPRCLPQFLHRGNFLKHVLSPSPSSSIRRVGSPQCRFLRPLPLSGSTRFMFTTVSGDPKSRKCLRLASRNGFSTYASAEASSWSPLPIHSRNRLLPHFVVGLSESLQAADTNRRITGNRCPRGILYIFFKKPGRTSSRNKPSSKSVQDLPPHRTCFKKHHDVGQRPTCRGRREECLACLRSGPSVALQTTRADPRQSICAGPLNQVLDVVQAMGPGGQIDCEVRRLKVWRVFGPSSFPILTLPTTRNSCDSAIGGSSGGVCQNSNANARTATLVGLSRKSKELSLIWPAVQNGRFCPVPPWFDVPTSSHVLRAGFTGCSTFLLRIFFSAPMRSGASARLGKLPKNSIQGLQPSPCRSHPPSNTSSDTENRRPPGPLIVEKCIVKKFGRVPLAWRLAENFVAYSQNHLRPSGTLHR